MAQINSEIVIDRPIDFVFTFMSEKMDDYLVRLDPKLLIVEQISEGEVSTGTQYRLISSKSSADRDPTKTELIKGLDLDSLEPELRNQVKEGFVEITALERNKLLEFIRVDEDNQRILERYTFRAIQGSTVLSHSPEYSLSEVVKAAKSFSIGKTGFRKLAFRLLLKPMIKFSNKMQLKSLKTIIEAEPDV